MKKLGFLLLILISASALAQNTQSITGKWTLAKVIKVDNMTKSELAKGKEMLEGNVIYSFNEDGTFKSTADTKKEAKTWIYQRKARTIQIKGNTEHLKIKIISFKSNQMRVKMNLSKSVLGEVVLVKN